MVYTPIRFLIQIFAFVLEFRQLRAKPGYLRKILLSLISSFK